MGEAVGETFGDSRTTEDGICLLPVVTSKDPLALKRPLPSMLRRSFSEPSALPLGDGEASNLQDEDCNFALPKLLSRLPDGDKSNELWRETAGDVLFGVAEGDGNGDGSGEGL